MIAVITFKIYGNCTFYNWLSPCNAATAAHFGGGQIFTIDFSKVIKAEKGMGIYAGELKEWQEDGE